MSQQLHFPDYKSPNNIVIIPTVSFEKNDSPPAKKLKLDSAPTCSSTSNIITVKVARTNPALTLINSKLGATKPTLLHTQATSLPKLQIPQTIPAMNPNYESGSILSQQTEIPRVQLPIPVMKLTTNPNLDSQSTENIPKPLSNIHSIQNFIPSTTLPAENAKLDNAGLPFPQVQTNCVTKAQAYPTLDNHTQPQMLTSNVGGVQMANVPVNQTMPLQLQPNYTVCNMAVPMHYSRSNKYNSPGTPTRDEPKYDYISPLYQPVQYDTYSRTYCSVPICNVCPNQLCPHYIIPTTSNTHASMPGNTKQQTLECTKSPEKEFNIEKKWADFLKTSQSHRNPIKINLLPIITNKKQKSKKRLDKECHDSTIEVTKPKNDIIKNERKHKLINHQNKIQLDYFDIESNKDTKQKSPNKTPPTENKLEESVLKKKISSSLNVIQREIESNSRRSSSSKRSYSTSDDSEDTSKIKNPKEKKKEKKKRKKSRRSRSPADETQCDKKCIKSKKPFKRALDQDSKITFKRSKQREKEENIERKKESEKYLTKTKIKSKVRKVKAIEKEIPSPSGSCGSKKKSVLKSVYHIPKKQTKVKSDVELSWRRNLSDSEKTDSSTTLSRQTLSQHFSKLSGKNNFFKNISRKKDNLSITVHNEDKNKEEHNISASEENIPITNKKGKSKKHKKIQLVINVLCGSSDSSCSDDDVKQVVGNEDLSFLDDINIDEIVESLVSKKEQNKDYEHDIQIITDDEISDASTVHLEDLTNFNGNWNENNNVVKVKTEVQDEKDVTLIKSGFTSSINETSTSLNENANSRTGLYSPIIKIEDDADPIKPLDEIKQEVFDVAQPNDTNNTILSNNSNTDVDYCLIKKETEILWNDIKQKEESSTINSTAKETNLSADSEHKNETVLNADIKQESTESLHTSITLNEPTDTKTEYKIKAETEADSLINHNNNSGQTHKIDTKDTLSHFDDIAEPIEIISDSEESSKLTETEVMFANDILDISTEDSSEFSEINEAFKHEDTITNSRKKDVTSEVSKNNCDSKPVTYNIETQVVVAKKSLELNAEAIDESSKNGNTNKPEIVIYQASDSMTEINDIRQIVKKQEQTIEKKLESPEKRLDGPQKSEEQSIKSKSLVKLRNETKSQGTKSRSGSPISIKSPVQEQKTKPHVVENLIEGEKYCIEQLESRMLTYLGKPYTITKVIKRGCFSNIFQCTDPKGKKYAVKVSCMKGNNKENKLMIVKAIQKDIPKENLNFVYIYEGFTLGARFCYLMDYYPKNLNRELQECDKPFHINVVQILSRQLVAAVTVLRHNNVVHTDIKPEHILLNSSNNNLKLCGFDEAQYAEHLQIRPNYGTVNYRAPEVILGYTTSYSMDVWSTALVMYEMATCRQILPGKFNNDILYKQICTFGTIPAGLIKLSKFAKSHFSGLCFKRRWGPKGQYHSLIPMDKFFHNKILQTTIMNTYNTLWGVGIPKSLRNAEIAKVNQFTQLLEKMLVVDPHSRLPIEFVFADPFLFQAVN